MLEIRLLGPLGVVVDGQPVRVGSTKQRAILALLALRLRRVVPVAEVVDALWGDDVPATATNAVQVHISALRKALGPAGALIMSRPPGYLLADGVVDVMNFEQSIEEARAGRSERWRVALTQWSGQTALADLRDVPFAAAAATRLEDLRLAATEEAIEHDLAAGEHAACLDELIGLTERHPYREVFWRQLMIALYRCDRQSDALAAYRRAARVLAGELGVEPGPALVAIHSAVLAHDPSLTGPKPVRVELPPRDGELIGRDEVIEDLCALLNSTRLVTLIGTGGVGKTRVAIEVAHRLEAEFVALADVRTAEAATARITVSSDRVLVLDNVEQIEDADVLVRDLLDRTERALLVTSRSAIDLRAETVIVLSPLPQPSAVELFAVEARRAGATAPSDPATVAAICVRLDGLPLAIVLAAARCRTLPPAEILALLGREGLGTGPKDLPERQRTLRATVQWSVDLLPAPARDLFCDLAVFGAPFTTPEVEEVTGAAVHLPDLIEASLVTSLGSRSYLLETVRDCARAMLTTSGRDTDFRHAAWVSRRAAELAMRLDTRDEMNALDEQGRLIPEVKSAVHHLVTSDADAAARLLLDTRRAWLVQGRLAEVLDCLTRVIPAVTAPALRAELAALHAIYLKISGDPDGRRSLEAAVKTMRTSGCGAHMMTNALCHLAALQAEAGEPEAALACAGEAVASARAVGGGLLSMALDLSSYVAQTVGDPEHAVSSAQEAVDVARAEGGVQIANALATLAEALAAVGRTDEAERAGLEAITLARSEFPLVRINVLSTVALALGYQTPQSVIEELRAGTGFLVSIGCWPDAAQATVALAGVDTDPVLLAKLIAAVSRHLDDPRLRERTEVVRARLDTEVWLDAAQTGAAMSTDALARLLAG